MKLKRQDKNGVRQASDIERKYKLGQIDYTAEEIEELKKKIITDEFLSNTSTNPVQNKVVTKALNDKVTKETGKGLSSNDFTTTLKNKLDGIGYGADENIIESISVNGTTQAVSNKNVNLTITDSFTSDYQAQVGLNTAARHSHSNKSALDSLTQAVINNSHTHSNKSALDNVSQTKINNWDRAATKTSYNLASYKVSALTILRSSCIKKDDRVAINFVGTINMAANTTTTIFNFPSDLQPTATKDFVVFGQSSNTDGYIGYGYVTDTGLVQVRFNTAISSYIRFSCVYDLD